MTFKDWTLARYLGKDTPMGDFAEDLARMDDTPEEDRKEAWLDYLRYGRYACHEAVDVFERLWASYEKWNAERKRY